MGGWGWWVTHSAPEPPWAMPAKQNSSGRCQHSSWSPQGCPAGQRISLVLALHPWPCQPSPEAHRAWHPPGAWETPAGSGRKRLPLLRCHCVPGRGQRVTATCGGTAHGAKGSSALLRWPRLCRRAESLLPAQLSLRDLPRDLPRHCHRHWPALLLRGDLVPRSHPSALLGALLAGITDS